MFTRAEIKAAAKSQIKGNIGILFLITLVFIIAASIVSSIPALGALVVMVASPAIGISFCMIYLELVNYGTKPAFGDLLKGFDVFGKALWLNILISIFTYLWSLLFIIPGIIKALSYSMSSYILAENPHMTAREALKESKEIMHGHKSDLFVLYLSFIGWLLLVSVTFGLAAIYVEPYMQATLVNFYNKIKKTPSVVVDAPAAEIAEEVIEAPVEEEVVETPVAEIPED